MLRMATTIEPGAPVITLINVFTVAPEQQRELVELLETATEKVMRHLQGFVSANIHASLDGTHVANYAQWRSEEHFKAMLADPIAQEHMQAAAAMAEFEPVLYAVESSHHI
jgi:quinol monooxygenase YgiN